MATRTLVSPTRRPGIAMRFSDYTAAVGINFSTLKHMATSPLHYRYALEHPPADTPAMLLGRATHTAVFEPDRFQLDYAVWPGERRGNAYLQFAEGCQAQGRSVLRESEYETALAIRDSVRGTPEVAALLSKGYPEVSLFWNNPPTGMACKGRLDWISGEGAILDLKTTNSIDPRRFSTHSWEYGYFHQASMYQEAYTVSSGMGSILRCGIIAVESSPPHACRLYWLDPDSLSRAWGEYVTWLERVQDCTETGIWPGPGPVESELAAPAWAISNDGETVDFDGVEE